MSFLWIPDDTENMFPGGKKKKKLHYHDFQLLLVNIAQDNTRKGLAGFHGLEKQKLLIFSFQKWLYISTSPIRGAVKYGKEKSPDFQETVHRTKYSPSSYLDLRHWANCSLTQDFLHSTNWINHVYIRACCEKPLMQNNTQDIRNV